MTPAARLASAKQQYELAMAAHRQDKLADAARHYGEVHKLFPTHPGALHGLGLIALREHRYDDAARFLRQSTNAAPDNAAIRCDLGVALLRLGRYEEALASFRAVLRSQPDNSTALNGAGDALNILGRPEEAQAAFNRTLARAPDNAAAHFGWGSAAAQMGDVTGARSALECAIALSPARATYHRALAELTRFVTGDPRLAALEALAREENHFPDAEKIELHFALAKAYDDLGRYDDAFANLEKANRLHRAATPYDESAVASLFEELRKNFTADLLLTPSGNPSSVPVFIVSMPRSGTTLVEQILSCDPSVFGAGELTYIQELVAEGEAGDTYPDRVSTLPKGAFARLGKRYLQKLGKLPAGAKHVLDKFPGNFQHIGLIHLALPNAKIIHMRRDPMDTCFSCYSKLFLNGLNYAYDLGELGRYYRMFDALMDHWRRVLPTGVMLEVRYEALVGNFENEARKIVAFCGLEWNDRFLAFHENARAVRTHSMAQVREPLFSSSVGRWRNYEKYLKPLRDALDQA